MSSLVYEKDGQGLCALLRPLFSCLGTPGGGGAPQGKVPRRQHAQTDLGSGCLGNVEANPGQVFCKCVES